MSMTLSTNETPIYSEVQLAEYLAGGCKPPERHLIGTEHEKFVFRRNDYSPAQYDGPSGINALLDGLMAVGGGEAVLEDGNIIGIKLPSGAAISLEPGGQFELSGAPLPTLHDTHDEFEQHVHLTVEVAGNLGLGLAPLGFHPTGTREQMPWMPKGRYRIMKRYMSQVGSMGLDMMLRTCTVQVNLDFSSELDMVRKLRASIRLQPLATALFANSPFVDGRPSGHLSARAEVWRHVDAARCGVPKCIFDSGFGFERYARWLIDDVPMYFIHRQGQYTDATGYSFRDFMRGRAQRLQDYVATVGDFGDHVTTAFPDVRLKQYLEMRGADAGTPAMMLAQSAFWVGLLYNPESLDAIEEITREMNHADVITLRDAVPRSGLAAKWRGHSTLLELARLSVDLARKGLAWRARLNRCGQDETKYLDVLDAIVDGAPTQAQAWLRQHQSAWSGSLFPIWDESALRCQ